MTILIPVLDGDRYIARSLSSVFNQRSKDWDVQVLIDCATKDNSYKKAKKIRDGSSRSRSIHVNVSAKPGLPQVYKELIDRAEPQDDVCGFLDVDDRIVPRAVELLMATYQSKPEFGHVWTQFCMYPKGSRGWSKRLPVNVGQLEAFTQGWWGAQHWRTFRKSVYTKSPYPLQLDIPYATDYNLALVLGASDCPTFFLDKPLYVYYMVKGGITQSKHKKQKACFTQMHRRFKQWALRRARCES